MSCHGRFVLSRVHCISYRYLLPRKLAAKKWSHSYSTQQRELPEAWKKTYAAKSKEDLLEAYAQWSQTYDRNSVQEYGYVGPKRASQEFVRHLCSMGIEKSTARLADIGAGTGLVGEHLWHCGYKQVTAFDFSAEMLQVAKKKKCYNELLCVDLNEWPFHKAGTTDFPASFDGAISVGTFTENHVGTRALLNVIKLLKPGGLLTLSLTEMFVDDSSNGFRSLIEDLEQRDVLKLIEITQPEVSTPKVSETNLFRVWSYRVT